MQVRMAGDAMMLVELETTIDPVINERAIDLAARLARREVAGVRDLVPGYCTLGIHFDPLRTDLATLERTLAEEAAQVQARQEVPPRTPIDIRVAYGGAEGPDLEAVAAMSGCTPAEVIEMHAAVTYRVYMLGFVPGFAYMGCLDRRIVAPRHRVPRDSVAAGSVGVTGKQTGVYSMDTPGGWQIIGRTPVVMFDAGRTPASRLAAGDLVRFVPQ